MSICPSMKVQRLQAMPITCKDSKNQISTFISKKSKIEYKHRSYFRIRAILYRRTDLTKKYKVPLFKNSKILNFYSSSNVKGYISLVGRDNSSAKNIFLLPFHQLHKSIVLVTFILCCDCNHTQHIFVSSKGQDNSQ